MIDQVHGVSALTARKWLGRYLALGQAGLVDSSSRSACSPHAFEPTKALTVVKLRCKRLKQAHIVGALGPFKEHCRWLLRDHAAAHRGDPRGGGEQGAAPPAGGRLPFYREAVAPV